MSGQTHMNDPRWDERQTALDDHDTETDDE